MNDIATEILRRELGKRCATNPRYSLRAFAKALEISPASLSLILNGKRLPSRKSVKRITEKIELTARERRDIAQGFELTTPVQDNLSLEQAEKICNWVCYAILSLTATKGFRSDAVWIGKRLGISVHEVRAAVSALVKAGVLDCKTKLWRQLTPPLRIKNSVSTAKTKEFQRDIILRAISSMDNDPMDQRDLTSITFAMSPQQMAAAKEEIRRFRLRMAELFEQKEISEEVYNLTIQLVPISRRP